MKRLLPLMLATTLIIMPAVSPVRSSEAPSPKVARPAAGGESLQPLEEAYQHLRAAQKAIARANDSGGHKVKAEHAIDEAIREVESARDFLSQHMKNEAREERAKKKH